MLTLHGLRLHYNRMVDYNELRRKFKAKKPVSQQAKTKAAVKAIAREYEIKKAGLESATVVFSKGPRFYALIIVLLLVLGSLVVPGIMTGRLTVGKQRIEKNDLNARKAMDALSIALGRYKFHVGEYPSNEEGLAVLAYRKPKEIQKIRRAHPTWDGPYVDHIVKDPWGNEYFYETRPEGGHPVLYSKGPDGRAGTPDDVMPEQLNFDQAFQDTSWTNHWAPAELRGYVVAPDEATRKRVQEQMKQYD